MDEPATDIVCMACDDARCHFAPLRAKRRALGPRDVRIELRYCGCCHSDVVNAHGDLKAILPPPQYPYVPGHELAGVVTAVGSEVTKFKLGDFAGVGCMVDACLDCDKCRAGEEQMCRQTSVMTYGGVDKHGRAATEPPGQQTMGGYATAHVVDERFGVKIPVGYPLEAAGPVMCAGVTMYDPMRRYGVKFGTKVGIIGLGGLGQMGVKIARALGASVTVISQSERKRTLAMSIGAQEFVCTEDADQLRRSRGTLDIILNTVPVAHDYWIYQKLLSRDNEGRVKGRSKQVILGLHAGLAVGMVALIIKGDKSPIVSSGIGGIEATQEVMDLCAKYNIVPDITVMPVSRLSDIYEALDAGNDTGTRYVLDIESMAEAVKNGAEESLRNARPPKLEPNRTEFNAGAIVAGVCKLLCCCFIC